MSLPTAKVLAALWERDDARGECNDRTVSLTDIESRAANDALFPLSEGLTSSQLDTRRPSESFV